MAASLANRVDSRLSDSQQIIHALERTGWNKAKTARMLGMSRRTIYRKMAEYKIPLTKEPKKV